jgi:hypothetical protein
VSNALTEPRLGRHRILGRTRRQTGLNRAARSVLLEYVVELIALMFVLLVLALAALPMWPYSVKWTYYPAVGCGVTVAAIALLTLGGRL